MKWIGQHIWDFISRFRSDVYLEDISTGTIASGSNLGLDSDNKIVKASAIASVTVTDSSTNAQYPLVFHDDSNNLLDDTDNFQYNPGKGTLDVLSVTASCPEIKLTNQTSDATGPNIEMITSRGVGGASTVNDNTGKITFAGYNNAGTPEQIEFARIDGIAKGITDTDEFGRLELTCATSDGSTSALQNVLSATGHATSNTVGGVIGYGAASVTTIAGTLTMGSTATIDNSGVWVGGVIPSAKLDADTAHLTTTQTFTGDKTFSAKCTVDSRVYALPGTNDGDHAAGDVGYFGGTTSMTAGKCYYLTDGGAWAFSNAGADATATGLLAIALGAASDTDGMLLRGMVTPYSPAASPNVGDKIYLRVQDGTVTTAVPTSSGNFARIVGYMVHDSNDAMYFCPDNTYVEIA